MISVPALMLLVVIGMGLAYYLIGLSLVERINAIEPPAASSQAVRDLQVHAGTFLIEVIAVLVVFSIIAVGISLVLVWTLLRPIRMLADAAATITRGDIRPTIDLRDSLFEVAQLGRTFNSMVDFINSMAEQREAFLSEGIHMGSMMVNVRGKITTINGYGLELLGAGREALIGKTIDEVRNGSPDLAPEFLEWCLEQVKETEALPREAQLEAGRNGRVPLAVSASVLRDERNLPSAVLVNFRDASEAENLKDLFNRTDQLAALGTFTYGLSQELRNPLAALKGTAQLLGEMVADRQDCQPYVRRMEHEANRLDRLMRELYDFSHSPAGQPEANDLNDLARRARAWAEQELSENVREGKRVVEDFDLDLPRVLVQSDRMTRAISNVIVNAFENMPEGATLILRTLSDLPSDPSETGSVKGPLGPAILEIENTGSTVSEENQGRIFEPFFSTKAGGSGLGLAISYQVLSQNRGHLAVDARPDSVCFRFIFRAVQPKISG